MHSQIIDQLETLGRSRNFNGIGAGAALTAGVWGRGRENSIWSAIEPDLQAVERGVICIASNENPVGPGPKVLGTLKTLLENGARPGRYSNQAGELTDAIAAHFKVKPDNVLVSEGSTENRSMDAG